MSRQQQSKRDRGRASVGLPPKPEPTYGYCPDCGAGIWNRGAPHEACPGRILKRAEPCPHMVVRAGAFNVRVPCSRPRGHEGVCE